MQKEAADEFVRIERHFADAGAMPVVFPAKSDLVVLKLDEAVVGNSNSVYVATQVIEHLRWTAERRKGVNHPFRLLG